MSTLVCKNVKLQDPTGTLVSTLSYDGNNITLNKPLSVPTAVAGTNNNQVATTGFVINEKGGRKNYLINGNFDKWDYGTSQTFAGYGSDNRWNNGNGGSTKTHSQQVCGDTERALFNAMYYSRTVVSSVAGDSNMCFKIQAIENVNLLAGKTVTLSFWAKADANKNIAVEFAQHFGSGGSPSADVLSIGSQLIALTTTWQKKTITLTIPSIAGKTLGTDGAQNTFTGLLFWLDSGSKYATRSANLGQQSGTFDIAQVKLEDGSVATNGWHPYDGEFGSETQACARYYETSDTLGIIANEVTDIDNRGGGVWRFRSVKRIIPTIIFNGALSDYAIHNYSTDTDISVTGLSCVATNLGSTRILASSSSNISRGHGTDVSSHSSTAFIAASAEL
jgi:hypothetical protein